MGWLARGTVAQGGRGASVASSTVRLAVAWQHPETRAISPIGILEFDAVRQRYCFYYVRNALSVDGFRPLLGFPRLMERYEADAPKMFPLFSERIMDARRPDYPRYLARLRLSQDVTPFEVLGRSGGHRMGDNIQVCPEPTVAQDGQTRSVFLVSGVRHVLEAEANAESRFAELRNGEPLLLIDEPDNSWNNRAILVSRRDRQRLGWVPDLLLDYVHAVRDSSAPELYIEQINGREVPPHLRLLVRLEGKVPPDYRPFSGPRWEPLA